MLTIKFPKINFWLVLLLMSIQLSASGFPEFPNLEDLSSPEKIEAKCDCDVMSQSFSIEFRDRCTAVFQFEDFWEPCIEDAAWSVNGVFYSSDLNPAPYEFCGSGVFEITLTIKLITGEKCEFSRRVEVDCPSCCNCERFQAAIQQTPTINPCALDLQIDPAFEECIRDIKWNIGGTAFAGTLNPPAVLFTDAGPHRVCVKVVLADGTICEYCRDYELPGCTNDCNCEKVRAGVAVAKPQDCKWNFKLDTDLRDCVRKLEWTINGTVVSNSFTPPTYMFPGSGSYELCLRVLLVTGEECKFCWKEEVECPEDCDCEDVKAGIKVTYPTTCTMDLSLDSSLIDCVKDLKWSVDGNGISDSFDPPVYTFPASGVYRVCLTVILANGEECEFCWEVEARCPDNCNCEKIKDGIKVDYPTRCSMDLELDPDLEKCVEKIEWTVNGTVISDVINPPVYTFPGTGVYRVCVKVLLINGETCEFCWEVETQCEPECNCEKIKSGLQITRPDECSIDLGLDRSLRECVRDIKWTVNGVLISNAFNPPVYNFPASGVYEVCVTVILTTGEECNFCWKVEANCRCDCERVRAGVNFRQGLCKLDFWLDASLKECIKDLKWGVNGTGYSSDFDPPTLPTAGLGNPFEVCLYVVLATGEECKFCWKIENPCPFETTEEGSVVQPNTTDKAEELILYPNPTNDAFTIEVPHNGNATLQITDLTGRLLYTRDFQGVAEVLREQIEVRDLSDGLYLISLDLGDRIITRKLTVQKRP